MSENVAVRLKKYTSAELAVATARGDILELHENAIITDAAVGTPQWIRGTGASIASAETLQASGQAPGAAGVRPRVVTATALALTYDAHDGTEVHVNSGGSLLQLVLANFPAAADILIVNDSGAAITISAPVSTGTNDFAEFDTADQDAATPAVAAGIASATVPNDAAAQLTVDAGGRIRLVVQGNIITKAAFDSAQSTQDTNIGTRELAANKTTAVAQVTAAETTKYAAAAHVYEHVAARRGAFTAAAITASAALTAWDEVRVVSAAAQDVIVTLPSVASQDGELVLTRIDNSTNLVLIRASGVEALLGVPAGTTYISLLPGGSIRLRATAAGAAKLAWSSPGAASRLWTPADMTRAIDADFTGLAAGAVSSVANTGSLGGTFGQAVTGAQPAIAADASGVNGAVFDGTADFLESSIALPLGQNYSLFVAVRPTLPNGGTIIGEVFAGDGNITYTIGYLGMPGGTGSHIASSLLQGGHYNGAWRARGAAANSVSGAIDVGLITFDGANHNLRRFGTDNTVAQTSLPSATANSEKTRIGRRWDAGTPDFYGGTIFRCVGKAGVFTTDEMERLEGYAAHLLGASASLTTAHKYKNAPSLLTLVQY